MLFHALARFIFFFLLELSIAKTRRKKSIQTHLVSMNQFNHTSPTALTKLETIIQSRLNQIHSLTPIEHLRKTGLQDIYLINLDRRSDRLFRMELNFAIINLPFHRFRGVDGLQLRDFSMIGKPIDLSHIHPNTSFPIHKLYEEEGPFYSHYGDFGCWQSHLQLYFHIVEKYERNHKDGPILILEDDINFEILLSFYIHLSLQQLPDNWDLLAIGYWDMRCCEKAPRKIQLDNKKTKRDTTNDPIQICATQYFWCTHGYIIRGVETARKLIKYSNVPYAHSPDYSKIQKADHYWKPLFVDGTINAYGILPRPLIIQDRKQFGTDIPDSGRITDLPRLRYSVKEVIEGIKSGKFYLKKRK